MTCARMRTLFGRTNVSVPSRFLQEIPPELLEGNPAAAERSFGGSRGGAFGQRDPGARAFGSTTSQAGGGGFGATKPGMAQRFAGGSQATFSRPGMQAGDKLPGHGQGAGVDWKVGDRVQHGKWGTGTVVKVKGTGDDMELDIAFPSPTGIKKLLAKFAPIQRT